MFICYFCISFPRPGFFLKPFLFATSCFIYISVIVFHPLNLSSVVQKIMCHTFHSDIYSFPTRLYMANSQDAGPAVGQLNSHY